MKEEKRENPNFININHGKLSLNVPRGMFKDGTTQMIEPEVKKFTSHISSRYPWLSNEALKVILEEARLAMERDIEQRRKAHDKARERISRGDLKEALKLIEDQLVEDPLDADAWYVAGEVLCKLGRLQEGYRALGRAKELATVEQESIGIHS